MPDAVVPPPMSHPECLSAAVLRVLYRSPDSSYVVTQFRAVTVSGDTPAEFVGVGEVLGGFREGIRVELVGHWEETTRFGRRYRILAVRFPDPSSLKGVRAFLGSGVIRGLGPTLAGRVVERFGEATLEVLDRQPERLLEVEGIGPLVAQHVTASWQAQRRSAAALAQLCGHGVSSSLAFQVMRQFQHEACAIVEREPYRLMELHGVGFVRADRIATRQGISGADPRRVAAGILCVIAEARQQGHACLPREKVVKAAMKLLALDSQVIQHQLAELQKTGRLIEEQGIWYLPTLREAERTIEACVAELVRQPLQESLLGSTRVESLHLNALQEQALKRALCYPLSVLTGAAGTGKTMVVGALVRQARRLGETVVVCAPTGKAAMRLAEVGVEGAQTIHRALEYVPGRGCRRTSQRPIDAELIIVDEASLLELELAHDLCAAVDARRSRLVFVGDDGQLPSIGPGQVFRDLIASGVCPVTRLEEVQRQAAQSSIVRLAHQVRQGQLPSISQDWGENHVWYPLATPEEIQQKLVDVLRALAAEQGVALADCQVLVPFRRGPLGTEALNRVLQDVAAPFPCPMLGAFRVGDRVLHVINDYQRDVFNGDVGRVIELNEDEQYLLVQFGHRQLAFLATQLDRLELAYCLTIHKAQGSEFSRVVLILHISHYIGLRAELLYSAVTRAKHQLILMGSAQAYHMAARQQEGILRYSGLFRRPQLLPRDA